MYFSVNLLFYFFSFSNYLCMRLRTFRERPLNFYLGVNVVVVVFSREKQGHTFFKRNVKDQVNSIVSYIL